MRYMDFNKHHLRNCLRTLKKCFMVEIIEDYANSLGVTSIIKWKGRLINYSFTSYPENAFCVLELTLKNLFGKEEISFDIPYDSKVMFDDVRKGKPYIIDYINSGPHCQYIFKKLLF